jgi:hypothetical protein
MIGHRQRADFHQSPDLLGADVGRIGDPVIGEATAVQRPHDGAQIDAAHRADRHFSPPFRWRQMPGGDLLDAGVGAVERLAQVADTDPIDGGVGDVGLLRDVANAHAGGAEAFHHALQVGGGIRHASLYGTIRPVPESVPEFTF